MSAGGRTLPVVAEAGRAGIEFVEFPGLLPGAVVSAVGYRWSAEPGIHLGLPSPSLTLVLSVDEPVVTGSSPEDALGPAADRNHAVLAGLRTRPSYIAQPEAQTGVQLAVHPLSSRALFGVPAGELTRGTVDGAEVLGRRGERVREQLGEARTWSECSSALVGFLRPREEPRRPRADVVEVWREILRSRGRAAVADLARHVLLSPRQLNAVFRAEFGLGPKALSRLVRFEHARQQLADSALGGGVPDLSRLAQQCGYSDHPHLAADFRQYTGRSPSRWLGEERRNIQAGAHRRGADFDA